MLGALPGKKSLIYFSTGAPRTAAQNQLQAAVDAAVRANVAFYPIDASGLSAPAPYVLCREDTVSVSVQGDPRFDGAYIIRPDGMISIPLVGEIKAAGLTPLELQHAINQALLPRLKTPRTFVNVLKVHLPGK
jgi:polysaccharide export outer membrane protein